MASIDALLDGPRAQRAFLLKAVFAGKWSISVEDQAPLTIVVVAQGQATFTGVNGTHRVGAGDVVVARGPAPYVFADSATSPVDIRILPGQVCVDSRGSLVTEEMALGVRTWGNTRREDEATVMLIGTYERETNVGSLLLAQLPETAVLHEFDPSLVGMLASELVAQHPGQSVVLDRLLDLIAVTVVRTLPASAARSSDAPITAAQRAIEERPDHPWTVASLASHVGLSRAALARRFTRSVGEPPLAYLTRWRLALAADLVVGTDLTLSSIAPRVGYTSPFALSAAFKRTYGVSPAQYRTAHAA